MSVFVVTVKVKDQPGWSRSARVKFVNDGPNSGTWQRINVGAGEPASVRGGVWQALEDSDHPGFLALFFMFLPFDLSDRNLAMILRRVPRNFLTSFARGDVRGPDTKPGRFGRVLFRPGVAGKELMWVARPGVR
jgi:hypothetical protein